MAAGCARHSSCSSLERSCSSLPQYLVFLDYDDSILLLVIFCSACIVDALF